MSAGAREVYDPVLRQQEAARYLGCSARTLRRLTIERHPVPATGRPIFGYRLSALNAYLDRLRDPRSRAPLVRAS